MEEIIAKATGAVHTHTGNLVDKNIGAYAIRPWNNICAKHKIIETDQLLI